VDGSPIDEEDSSDEECWCCEYCDKEFASEYEANKHEKNCKKTCFRCGRVGHYANECYASTHISGKWF
jgi:hypothetical protein